VSPAGKAGAPALACSNSPVVTRPALRISVIKVATATIGSFFGKYGVLDAIAAEMILASGGALPIVSRAVVSRYLAR